MNESTQLTFCKGIVHPKMTCLHLRFTTLWIQALVTFSNPCNCSRVLQIEKIHHIHPPNG